MDKIIDGLKFAGILSSKGYFRTAASILAALALIPQLSAYAPLLQLLAGLLGGGGVAKALVLKNAPSKAPTSPGSVITFQKP